MNRLKTITIWILIILQLNKLHNSHVIIETRIHHASIDVHKFINSSKYSYIG
jgi:hypothetical protein